MAFANRKIGTLSVSPIGLGAARWSMAPGANYDGGIEALNAGIDAGVTFTDTALLSRLPVKKTTTRNWLPTQSPSVVGNQTPSQAK
jgi:aryl-alcohol dehydrogenase-like predicted oxidoreductase